MSNFDRDHVKSNDESTSFISIGSGGVRDDLLILECTTTEAMKMTGTPNEYGVMQFDNRVTQPATCRIRGIVKKRNYGAFASAIQKSMDASDLDSSYVSVTHNETRFETMIVTRFEKRSLPERLDAVEVILEMTEFLITKGD